MIKYLSWGTNRTQQVLPSVGLSLKIQSIPFFGTINDSNCSCFLHGDLLMYRKQERKPAACKAVRSLLGLEIAKLQDF